MGEAQAIRELVFKLGGPKHVGGVLGTKAGNVSAWSIRGFIPWKWRATVKLLCNKAGIRLTKNQKQALSLQPEREAAA